MLRSFVMHDGLWRDILYASRSLRKSSGFAIATILLLSVGIGGSTLVFSAVDAILLRRLPVSRPHELARVLQIQHNRPPVSEYPFGVYDQWRSRTSSFSTVFAQSDLDVSLSDGSSSRPARAEIVTGEYFKILDAAPALGRLLTSEDEWAKQGGLPLVLSYNFWQRRFGRDPHVLGRTLKLNGQPFVVVGVTGGNFNGISIDSSPDLRVPFIAGQFLTETGSRLGDPRRCCLWEVAGRLRPDVPLAQAQAETLASMHAAFEAAFAAHRPLTDEDRRFIRSQQIRVERMDRGVSWLRERFSTGLLALMGGVAALLLLACANVAGLSLARVAAREQESAVRLALGATRGRVARQWLVESFVLAVCGGAGGLLIARGGMPFLNNLLPPMRNLLTMQLPATLPVALDPRVFGFALLACSLTATLVGLTPAWQASRADIAAALKSGPSDPKRMRMWALLVVAQVAICTIVLATSSLMLETLRNLDRMNPGFNREHVVTFTVDTATQKYRPEESRALAFRLEQETRSLPGVSFAAIAARALLRGGGLRTTVGLPGARLSAADGLNTDTNVVSPGYFETMGMRLLAGRVYSEGDMRERKPIPVIVNGTFARRYFPRGNPIGQRIGMGTDHVIEPTHEIVGVVADARYRSLREGAFPEMFECMRLDAELQNPFFQLEVRTSGKPESAIAAVQGLLRRLDPRLPFREIHTLNDEFDASLWAERTLARLGSLFSALAALLAGIGLYGLVSYTLLQRRREIGIRVALGAGPANIVSATLARTSALVLTGIAAGLVGSLAIGKLFESLLYGVSPLDPRANLAGIVLVLATAIAATLPPAIRASLEDPNSALRA